MAAPFPPAIRLSSDGVTYGAVGIKLQSAASATVYAKLDSIVGVTSVSWTVLTTDGTSAPGSFALTTSGVVGEKVQLTADVAGTKGRLQATINNGVGPDGNVNLALTQSVVAWWVPAANGLEVGAVDEQFESDSTYGTTKLVNAAIRGATGSSTGGVPTSRTISTTAPLTGGGDLTTNRTLAISAATDSTAGSMSAADKTKLDAMGGQVPPATPGAAVAGSGATPVSLFSVTGITTGWDAIVSFDVSGKITGGSAAGGHTGQRLAFRASVVFVNPSGTPTAGSGSYAASNGVYFSYDETGGFLAPTPLTYTFAANSATVKIAGLANVNVDWSAAVTSVSLLQE